MLALIYRCSEYSQYFSFNRKLEYPIREICQNLYDKGCNKFILEYVSSLTNDSENYYMFFKCSENDDEYILISDKFIPLKNIDSCIKKCAFEYFHAEGGVITEYGVFEK